MKFKLLFLALICVGMTAVAQKQVMVQSSVIDDFFETPLLDTEVTLMTSDSVPIKKMDIIQLKNSEGILKGALLFMNLTAGEKYLLHGTLEGYEDGWLQINVPKNAGSEMHGGDLRLQKHFSRDLDAVTVKATKVKMFWKGDTIVYNADAFKLPAGSMLDDLIRQMPGATLNDDGEIFVNGRKIDELLLGSKSFFNGKSQVLLKNLPYYTVKNIKVYDKESELNEAMGSNIETKKYVMDVNLSSQYNRGIIGNAEAAGGTSRRYLGRAFLLGFSDPFRFSVVANMNNVNETRHIGQSSSWTPDKMPKSRITTKSVAGELKFDNKKIEETVNAEYTFTSDLTNMNRRTELFLDGLTPLTTLSSVARQSSHKLKLHNWLKIRKPWIIVNLDYGHSSFKSGSTELSEQKDYELISRINSTGNGNGSAWNINASVDGSVLFKRAIQTYTNYGVGIKHVSEKSISMREYDFEFPAAPALYNVNDYMNRTTTGNLRLLAIMVMPNNFQINMGEAIILENSRKRDFLYRPDGMYLPSQKEALEAITDIGNSYTAHHTSQAYNTSILINKTAMLSPDETLSIPYTYYPVSAGIVVTPKIQSLDYHRGGRDSFIRSTDLLYRPEIRLQLFPTGKYKQEIDLKVHHSVETPSLYDKIDYRDDSKPLLVKLGNPSLKGDQYTVAEADYYRRATNRNILHIGAMFRYYHRATAQSVEYDQHTGTTTYRPVNVSGNYTAKATFDITRTVGPGQSWVWNTNADGSFDNNVDHSMFQGETKSHINEVRTLTLHDGMYLEFSKGSLNIRATGDISWRHSTGRMRDFRTLNALDFRYGLSARYTIPVLNTTVAADGTMYSRRGYGSSSLNTNDFVLNLSLSQPFLKGKLVARIEGFDLLHQLSQVQYEVNAQGRVETWYKSLPHYIMLHLVYNFSLSPKKK